MLRQLILLLTCLSLALAATPTSFCKCTCFSNSTIIPLTGAGASSPQRLFLREDEPVTTTNTTAPHARTCADCNKQFCLNYNLPICKDAEEEDVFTSCFQRDSFKDEFVVCVFILGTVGLLLWAAVRPVVQRWREGRRYAPVGGT
ncbi:uncharacterized protein RCC_01660 [Ramularia collo-cygni]|uniref:Uncharacterized protein n=1 Tax=Ramularia collo-cygni TaxID=112498 RepID=A0A2D3V034_9PEZI|nr:uncharacterized protein RCC_01660 [Ramularia collo-cygni]CZT15824.1 uncharacterized protein RCC_01660 [Ramularia collo-cygni]